MNTCASRRIFDRKPVRPFGLLIFLTFIAAVYTLGIFQLGRWVKEVEAPNVVYVPVKMPHPLTAWACTASEKTEYLRACFLRKQSMMTAPK